MKLRQAHVFVAPPEIHEETRFGREEVELVGKNRCVNCREKWAARVLVSSPDLLDDDMNDRVCQMVDRAMSRTWCYPNRFVRGVVRFTQAWLLELARIVEELERRLRVRESQLVDALDEEVEVTA
jgi:hypothetical protein